MDRRGAMSRGAILCEAARSVAIPSEGGRAVEFSLVAPPAERSAMISEPRTSGKLQGLADSPRYSSQIVDIGASTLHPVHPLTSRVFDSILGI
jgi:hypothetical protein